jgi:hypothetical protein
VGREWDIPTDLRDRPHLATARMPRYERAQDDVTARGHGSADNESTELQAVAMAACRYPPINGIFASVITFFHFAISALM